MANELLGKSKVELREFFTQLGEPAFRAAQLYHALYAERKFEIAKMTNLPLALRGRLEKEARVTMPEVKQKFSSTDGSVRYLLGLAKEEEKGINTECAESAEDTDKKEQKPRLLKPASVEAVYMPSEGRQTVCISTQAGCAVDCHFCLTAQLGLIRNLTPGEIVAQALLPLEEHSTSIECNGDTQEKQTNIVLMGQGEPFLNYEAVMSAVRIMLDPEGMAISPKHMTLSTSGIIPGIARMGQEKVRPKLAISLNASHDEKRDELMPINRKYPLAALIGACRDYPLRNWEHITFEYVMLGGVNDAPEDARRVAKLLRPLDRVKVNLIPWNPGELPYRESPEHRIEEFRQILVDRGVPAFVRYSRGRDVMAACGQLALLQIEGAQASV